MSTVQDKDVLTTGEVAKICHVAPRTVSKWFDTGKLRGYRIPGSRDRRIPRKQLEAFLRAHGMPMDALDGGTCRVLLIGTEAPEGLVEAMERSGRCKVRTAANGFQAGVLAEKFHPHVVVLDVACDLDEATALCRNIKGSVEFQAAKVVAAGAEGTSAELIDRGFDGVLSKPYSAARFAEAIEKVTDLIG